MTNLMLSLIQALADPLHRVHREESGAIGALMIGIIIGAIAVVVLIVKLLIPGD